MDFSDYQREARKTAIYTNKLESDLVSSQYIDKIALMYCALGLGEAGEIQNKVKKIIRDGIRIADMRDDLAAEIGDICWYCANMCTELGLDFGDVAQANIDKLASRSERGVLQGSGDNR
jgi:NTP pyrophosphatase (non-canonical NTP hydrolase)